MKNLIATSSKLMLSLSLGLTLLTQTSFSQCTPQGDQTSSGTDNTWIGYVYQGRSFNTYVGYVNEGNSGTANFDQSFGGSSVTASTNGCTYSTTDFSVRYKLTKTFASGEYLFTVGGDDGYRLSLDGGATWIINNWGDHGYVTSTYTAALSGSYDMVLEYYENAGENRVTFNVTTACGSSGDPAVYGTNNIWRGYVYQGMNFNTYRGFVTEGIPANLNFDQNFGGNNVSYATSDCPVNTQQFSVRYRLRKTFANGTYTFVVGADDGYRLSLDGGATWVINNWADLSYNTTTYTTQLNGTRDVVLEYYENGGDNRISMNMSFILEAILPVKLLNWSAVLVDNKAQLQWKTSSAINFSHFTVQRSQDGYSFQDVKTISYPEANSQTERSFSYRDGYTVSSPVYYRLAMVDIDGKTEYSAVIKLSGSEKITETKLYPTVVENGNLFIESAREVKNARLEIYSVSGNKVGQSQVNLINGRQQVSLGSSFPGVSAGSYIVLLSDSSQLIKKAVIFVK